MTAKKKKWDDYSEEEKIEQISTHSGSEYRFRCPFCEEPLFDHPPIWVSGCTIGVPATMYQIECSACHALGPTASTKSEAFTKFLQRGHQLTKPEYRKIKKELDTNWQKGHHNDYVQVDGNAEIVESALQHAWIRVGPVYQGKTQDPEPGIWIDTQKLYLNSPLEGTWLLSRETWKTIDKYIRKCFQQHDRYSRTKK